MLAHIYTYICVMRLYLVSIRVQSFPAVFARHFGREHEFSIIDLERAVGREDDVSGFILR